MADKAPKDTSLQSTKQMLDELDALMERMLSLPVNDLDEAPAPKETPKSGTTLAASLTLLAPLTPPPAPRLKSEPVVKPMPHVEPPAPKPLERRAKTQKTPHLPLKPPHLSRLPSKPKKPELEPSEPEPVAPPEPEPLSNEVLPPTVLPAMETLLTQSAESAAAAPAASWGLAPLLSINQAFDRATMYLGGAGRWLRSHGGRTLLGSTGVALFLAAAGWLVKDWLGWN